MRRISFNFIAKEGTGTYFALFLFSLCRGDTNRAIIYRHSDKLLFSVPFLRIFGSTATTSIELPPQAAYALSKWLQPSAIRHNCYQFGFLLQVCNLVRCFLYFIRSRTPSLWRHKWNSKLWLGFEIIGTI